MAGPALSSRIRWKSCTGTLGKMAFAIGRSKRKTFSFVSPGHRSVEDAKSSLKAMNSGEIVREEDGFLLWKGSGTPAAA